MNLKGFYRTDKRCVGHRIYWSIEHQYNDFGCRLVLSSLSERQWLAFPCYLLSGFLCVTMSATCFLLRGSLARGHLWRLCSPNSTKIVMCGKTFDPNEHSTRYFFRPLETTHLHACLSGSLPSAKAILNTTGLAPASFLLCFSGCFFQDSRQRAKHNGNALCRTLVT